MVDVVCVVIPLPLPHSTANSEVLSLTGLGVLSVHTENYSTESSRSVYWYVSAYILQRGRLNQYLYTNKSVYECISVDEVTGYVGAICNH